MQSNNMFVLLYILIMTLVTVGITTYDTNQIQQNARQSGQQYRRIALTQCSNQQTSYSVSSVGWHNRAISQRHFAAYYRSINRPTLVQLWIETSDESEASSVNNARLAKSLNCEEVIPTDAGSK